MSKQVVQQNGMGLSLHRRHFRGSLGNRAEIYRRFFEALSQHFYSRLYDPQLLFPVSGLKDPANRDRLCSLDRYRDNRHYCPWYLAL